MNISELVTEVSKKVGLSKAATRKVLAATLGEISGSVKKGNKVTLVGFGTFYQVQRKARKGRNPQTGEAVKIPAARVPRFRPGKALRDSVRKARRA